MAFISRSAFEHINVNVAVLLLALLTVTMQIGGTGGVKTITRTTLSCPYESTVLRCTYTGTDRASAPKCCFLKEGNFSITSSCMDTPCESEGMFEVEPSGIHKEVIRVTEATTTTTTPAPTEAGGRTTPSGGLMLSSHLSLVVVAALIACH